MANRPYILGFYGPFTNLPFCYRQAIYFDRKVSGFRTWLITLVLNQVMGALDPPETVGTPGPPGGSTNFFPMEFLNDAPSELWTWRNAFLVEGFVCGF